MYNDMLLQPFISNSEHIYKNETSCSPEEAMNLDKIMNVLGSFFELAEV